MTSLLYDDDIDHPPINLLNNRSLLILYFYSMKNPKPVPFSFVFDSLFPLEPVIKPMFGCHALYSGEKILLILRSKEDHADANGVWIATSKEHHNSLKMLLPSLRTIDILSEGKGETNWQMIHEDAETFEEDVNLICELIRKNDPRIGRIPKKKKKK
jgi:hypothetical protein